MRVWFCEVTETVAVHKLYRVKASTEDEARANLECGNTLSEKFIRRDGVYERTPDYTTLQQGPILCEKRIST